MNRNYDNTPASIKAAREEPASAIMALTTPHNLHGLGRAAALLCCDCNLNALGHWCRRCGRRCGCDNPFHPFNRANNCASRFAGPGALDGACWGCLVFGDDRFWRNAGCCCPCLRHLKGAAAQCSATAQTGADFGQCGFDGHDEGPFPQLSFKPDLSAGSYPMGSSVPRARSCCNAKTEEEQWKSAILGSSSLADMVNVPFRVCFQRDYKWSILTSSRLRQH